MSAGLSNGGAAGGLISAAGLTALPITSQSAGQSATENSGAGIYASAPLLPEHPAVTQPFGVASPYSATAALGKPIVYFYYI